MYEKTIPDSAVQLPPIVGKRTAGGYRTALYEVKLTRVRSVYAPTQNIGSSGKVANVLYRLLHDSPVEKIVVLYLSGRNDLLGIEIVAQGGISGASLLARDVFRGAVLAGASVIVLGHNHPSGSPLPSDEDVHLTKAVKAAGETIGIPLVDHVIVTPHGKYFSLFDNGMID